MSDFAEKDKVRLVIDLAFMGDEDFVPEGSEGTIVGFLADSDTMAYDWPIMVDFGEMRTVWLVNESEIAKA